MRKTTILSTLTLLSFFLGNGQNTSDPYKNLNGTSKPRELMVIYSGEFEFMILSGDTMEYYFPEGINLFSYSVPDSIKAKIELVSFPFTFECDSGCSDSTSIERIFVMPDDQFYDKDLPGWNTTHLGKSWPITQISHSPGDMSSPLYEYDLVSINFLRNSIGTSNFGQSRKAFAHSIYRTTIYYYYEGINGNKFVDSTTNYFDLTRGRLKHYPFKLNNFLQSSNTSVYDLNFSNIIHDTLENHSSLWGSQDFGLYSDRSNYSGYRLDYASGTWEYYPASPSSNTYDYIINNAVPNYIVPEGHFTIDKSIDLSKINPSQRTIYSPSIVHVSTPHSDPLVFPSGYTFKTVLGLAPSKNQLLQFDLDSLYPDPKNIPYPSELTISDNPDTYYNEGRSVYIVMPNSTLIIDPCVALYDMDIVVRTGGVLKYMREFIDTSRVNFIFNTGAIVDSIFQSQPTPYSCFYECYDASHFDVDRVNINSNTTWTTSSYPGTGVSNTVIQNRIRISKTLRISSGNTLTLQAGVYLEMGPKGKIIIEPGAKLRTLGTLNDSVTISSSCELQWEGIKLLGNPGVYQNGFSQGYLKFTYTKLENAKVGILTGAGAFSERKKQWKFTGGVLDINHTLFLNNSYSVKFLPYYQDSSGIPVPNKSTLKNSKFLWNSMFFSEGKPEIHIDVFKVFGLRLTNNEFINANSQAFEPHQRGIGIRSYGSNLKIRSSNGPNHTNFFRGFTEGIFHTGGPGDALMVYYSDFEDCIKGITIQNSTCSHIADCDFHTPESELNFVPATSPSFHSSKKQVMQKISSANNVGIHVLTSWGYLIENCEFNLSSNDSLSVGGNNETYGIVVNNTTIAGVSDGETGQVYRNKFGFVDNGLQIEGDNGLSYSGSYHTFAAGIIINCNKFENSIGREYDIKFGIDLDLGIITQSRHQGVCPIPDVTPYPIAGKMPANNIFSLVCDPLTSSQNIYTGGTSFNYNFHSSNYNNKPSCNNMSQGYVNNCELGFFNYNLSCPSLFNGAPNYMNPVEQVDFLDSVNTEFILKIDGGDTQYLLDQIQDLTNHPNQLTVELLNHSPYLSDTVLMEAFDRSIPFSTSQLFEIVDANSPLSEEAFEELEYQRPRFTDYMFSQIEGWQEGLSLRRELELRLDFAQIELNQVIKRNSIYAKSKMLMDTLVLSDDHIGGYELLMHQLEKELFEGNFAGASDLIENSFIGDFRIDLLGLEMEAWNDSMNYINNTFDDDLNEIIGHNPYVSFGAREWKQLISENNYTRRPWVGEVNQRNNIAPYNDHEINETDKIRVYPNPSSDEFIVEIELPINQQKDLVVYSLDSRRIFTAIVPKDQGYFIVPKLPKGTYILVIESGGSKFSKILIAL